MDTFILKGNETIGPLTRQEVLGGLADGTYSKEDFCAREGWNEWRKLGDVYKDRPIESKAQKRKKTPKSRRSWREDPVSERQRDLIKSKGMKVPKTKGEASDLIGSILGTGPSPRQIAKLKFLGISWTTVEEAWSILDAVEDDPAYKKKIADWDAKKASLYPDLYSRDGNYKDQKEKHRWTSSKKEREQKKIGCLIYIAIGFGILVCWSWFSNKGNETKTPEEAKPQATPTSSPYPTGRPASTPIKPITATPTPEAFPDAKYWPEKIHILIPVSLSGVVGGGKISSTMPAGTLLPAELSTDHKTITIHNLDLSGSISIEQTDFIERARKELREEH